jgi:serine phosphatase RsbU (regulator of sigma subunit)
MFVDFGAATRAHPAMRGVNGDGFVICRYGEAAVVGVIDGVGHGQYAQRAAATARREIETHCALPLEDIFRHVGRACRGTRGVAMALARFDCLTSTMQFASVGNVEVKTLGMSGPTRFVLRRGIVGLNAPPPSVTDRPWPDAGVLCMYSDGVHSRWDWPEAACIARRSATEIAGLLLRRYARDDDDATILVVKGKALE